MNTATRLFLGLLLGFACAGCAPPSDADVREDSTWVGAPTVDQATVDDALELGEIVLPPGAEVAGVNYSRGIDQNYTLVVRTPADEVDALLTGSGFTATLEPGRKGTEEVLPGFDLGDTSDTAHGRDRLEAGQQRAHTVVREVLVDRGDPAGVVVHWWVFTL